jgi:hypothetical protein
LSRRVSITESEIPGPYNILDLPEGQSIEFIATSYVEGIATREIVTPTGKVTRKAPIMRVFADLNTPVFGAPYIDVLAGRTIMLLKTIFEKVGLPLKLKLTAHGKEPSKWYTVEYEVLKK